MLNKLFECHSSIIDLKTPIFLAQVICKSQICYFSLQNKFQLKHTSFFSSLTNNKKKCVNNADKRRSAKPPRVRPIANFVNCYIVSTLFWLFTTLTPITVAKFLCSRGLSPCSLLGYTIYQPSFSIVSANSCGRLSSTIVNFSCIWMSISFNSAVFFSLLVLRRAFNQLLQPNYDTHKNSRQVKTSHSQIIHSYRFCHTHFHIFIRFSITIST